MPKHPLSTTALLGSREIRFLDRQTTNYPNLMRLCLDFDFCVIQLLHKTSVPSASKSFVLTTQDYRTTPTAAITPAFANMTQLEDYVTHHQVDILHDYLFGFVDEDIASGQAD
ncbi:hypothetical protein [Marinimicrobium sp. ABcell2]|uniref:hypothetical protein n=1 Tax=Marinimicrobium sp. ABcell2 TaxID=3069751 RepID=UPI0027B70CA4|nr:hypothetical protein [Marinimicrobium sp. ABcell2]MDQ2076498.1 hypothetical protein [Marinimicrobium sp. ABcell2]